MRLYTIPLLAPIVTVGLLPVSCLHTYLSKVSQALIASPSALFPSSQHATAPYCFSSSL